jgi:hypothetical protein
MSIEPFDNYLKITKPKFLNETYTSVREFLDIAHRNKFFQEQWKEQQELIKKASLQDPIQGPLQDPIQGLIQGPVINSSTIYVPEIENLMSKLKISDDGQKVLNPETGRWVSKTGPVGKKLLK